MTKKRKIKRRKKDLLDLEQLNKLFIKFCANALKEGEIDHVGQIIDFIKAIKNLQNNNLTYERVFIMKHLKRHGLLRDNFLNAIKESPMSEEEAKELKQIFGDQIEDIKELTK